MSSQETAHRTPADPTQAIAHLADAARPLATPADLDPLMAAIGDGRFVLLGEATHGTSEFYTWRTALSQRLIREKGFSFIGVEGDWPDCYRVNRFVRGLPDSAATAQEALHGFHRWPTWMWANREVVGLVSWLRAHNESRPGSDQVGFYGLDVYSLYESMNAVVEYLEGIDPALARAARGAYSCFEPYGEDPQTYAQATALVPTSCEDEAVAVLRALTARAESFGDDNAEDFFTAEQNALVARDAERYYRTMVRGGPTSWNVRDIHMADTLDRLMTHSGPDAKAIVWEHNTHVGDARFTDMLRRGLVNVGQLVRERHLNDGVCLVGFGTHRGSVIAGEEWGAPMRRMRVPPARRNSWEDMLHRADRGDCLIVFEPGAEDGGIPGLGTPHDHRAIGVVYDPARESWGNYVPTVLPGRYDAFLFVDESHAVEPLHMAVQVSGEPGETYPTGI
jgi:erythromycin esterase-like protein